MLEYRLILKRKAVPAVNAISSEPQPRIEMKATYAKAIKLNYFCTLSEMANYRRNASATSEKEVKLGCSSTPSAKYEKVKDCFRNACRRQEIRYSRQLSAKDVNIEIRLKRHLQKMIN